MQHIHNTHHIENQSSVIHFGYLTSIFSFVLLGTSKFLQLTVQVSSSICDTIPYWQLALLILGCVSASLSIFSSFFPEVLPKIFKKKKK